MFWPLAARGGSRASGVTRVARASPDAAVGRVGRPETLKLLVAAVHVGPTSFIVGMLVPFWLAEKPRTDDAQKVAPVAVAILRP